MTPGRQARRTQTVGDLFGHPPGLTVLFATEMWERFSYFGMSSLVVLYMNQALFQSDHLEAVIGYNSVKRALELLFGPLAPQPLASLIYGWYTGLAYLMPILGGVLADRVVGQRRTVLLGAVLMALGHFMMMAEALFLPALAMLILGIGLFKPNISTQVGGLYSPEDGRRVRAYAVFYVGINIGAFLAPLVCGTLGERVGWHYGFAAAGLGMLISLVIYLCGWSRLPPDHLPQVPADGQEKTAERRAVLALLVLCAPVSLFWATYDQQGNTILLWAHADADRSFDLWGWRGEVPTTWFLALNPLMIFAFTPVMVRLWRRRSATPGATLHRMALGCLGVALANLTLAAVAFATTGGKASAAWLLVYFCLTTLGELNVAPLGLALVSRVAPARSLSVMMGFWFATTFPGDLIGGFLGSFWLDMAKAEFFMLIAGVAALAAVAIGVLSSPLKAALEPL